MIHTEIGRGDSDTLQAPPLGVVSADPCLPSTPPSGMFVEQEDGTEKLVYEPTKMAERVHASVTPYLCMIGGRGSSKSTTLRWDVHMKAMTYPGYLALIVRNTFPALRRSHLKFIEAEMAALGGKFNKTENCAYYPNGSKLWFGACDDEATINSYLSSEFYYVGFDELVTIPLDTFLSLSACVRAPKVPGLVGLTRGATNTLGPHARWVKRWFVDKTVTAEESEDYDPSDFEVITSLLEDNQFLDAVAYRKNLGHQPGHVRRSWIHNEWVLEGSYFADFHPTTEGLPWHVINKLPTVKGKALLSQPWISIHRCVDWGWSPDPAVCLWIAVLPNKRAVVFKEKQWLMTTAADVAKDIVKESAGMRVVETHCDPTMFVASRASEGQSIGDIFEINAVPLTPSLNDRAAAGDAIHEWLNTVVDEDPALQILSDGCPNLIRTIPEMEMSKVDPRRLADGEDHYVISLGYFCQSWISPSRDPEVPAIPRWMQHKSTRQHVGAQNYRARASAA